MPIEIVTVDRGDASEVSLEQTISKLSIPYQEAAFAVPYASKQIHELPNGTLAEIVQQIISIEGPIHLDEIVARVRSLWGLQRAGSRIQAAVSRAVVTGVQSGAVVKDGNFYALPGVSVQVRDRSGTSSPSLLRPEMLPPSELRIAALHIIRRNYGAGRDEVVTILSRLLGFKATSAQLRATIEQCIDELLACGTLVAGEEGTLTARALP